MYICMKRIWHYITYSGCHAIKLNQTNCLMTDVKLSC